MKFVSGSVIAVASAALIIPMNAAHASAITPVGSSANPASAGAASVGSGAIPTLASPDAGTAIDTRKRSKRKKKRKSTTILGWSTGTTITDEGYRERVKVRVLTGGKKKRRVLVLKRKQAGQRWARVWKGKTRKRGKRKLTIQAPSGGQWSFRLKAKGSKRKRKRRTSTRTILAVPNPAPGVTRVHAVSDVGNCSGGNRATAALFANRAGSVVMAGDNAVPHGTPRDYRNCFAPAFGGMRDRIFPVPGNHEYDSSTSAKGYFRYFDSRVGNPSAPWYVKDFGSWRFFMLNSNCEMVGCGPDSDQYKWLKAQLAASPQTCTAAVWHHPRWTSSIYADDKNVRYLYELLDEAGADVLLTGHRHHYERFGRMNAAGQVDPQGIRQFVIGTGGQGLFGFGAAHAGSEVRQAGSHGALQLDLYNGGYSFEFRQTGSAAVTDSGSEACH